MIVTPAEFAQLSAQAIKEYPFECCGFILTRTTPEPSRLWMPCRNEQNELHRRDPLLHSRDATTAYRINDHEVMTMNQLVAKEGYRLSVLYHSHVEVGAYFSETDRKSALLNGEPSYPDTIYLVLSVRKRDRIEIDEAAAFRWDPVLRDFGAIDWRKPDG